MLFSHCSLGVGANVDPSQFTPDPGKTDYELLCWVPDDASEAVLYANQTTDNARGPCMGNCRVDVALSTQDDLLMPVFSGPSAL